MNCKVHSLARVAVKVNDFLLFFSDRLTKELLLLQQNGINANYETNNFKDKLAKSESEVLQLKMKVNETESNYNKLKRDTNIKMK